MSDIGSINPLTGVNPLPARATTGSRSESPVPPTVQHAVAQPLNTAQSAVTQSPTASGAEWQQQPQTDADGQRQNQAGTTAGRQQLAKTVDDINQKLQNYDTNLQFEMDDQYQQMVVRVVDRETKEVVRQIPSEKAMALAQFLRQLETEQSQRPAAKRTSDKDNSGLKIEGWLLRAIV
jgi:flagellar protein FlaG